MTFREGFSLAARARVNCARISRNHDLTASDRDLGILLSSSRIAFWSRAAAVPLPSGTERELYGSQVETHGLQNGGQIEIE